jgi:hypothetical protein
MYSVEDFESIVKGDYHYWTHKKICEERWNEKNKIVLANEKIIVQNEINWNYIKNYQQGYFLDFPLIENIESKNRLLEFASICMSEKAPLSQGYYFDESINVSRFIRGVIIKFLLDDITNFRKTCYHVDSEKIVDKIKSNEIMYYSFNEHEILFIFNSYNRYCHSKKHKVLYRIVNDILAEREKECKKSFVLSLTPDVGREKVPNMVFQYLCFQSEKKSKKYKNLK